jgi:hypothetical protein
MNIYLVMSIGGVIGIILHGLNSIRKINKHTPNVNLHQVFSEYIKSDKLSLLISAFCFIALLFISSEFVDLSHLEEAERGQSLKERLFHFKLAQFIKTSSIIAGYFSQYIVYGFLGKTAVNLKAQFKTDNNQNP